MAKPVHRKGRKRRFVSILAVLSVIAWIIGLPIFAESLPAGPDQPTQKTDAIVVLTGGTLRLETGIALLEAGLSKRLFVSGVHRGVEARELAGFAAKDPAVFECCVELGRDAEDTHGNAAETAAWLEGQDIRSLRLVTAAYHMPRALTELKATLPGIDVLVHPVFPERVKLDRWYVFPGTTALLSAEYSKFLLASVRIALWDSVIWFGNLVDGLGETS